MWLDILIYVSVLGAPALAIYSVWRRMRKSDPDTAGYVYNGKTWVTWLLALCILAILFYTFIMPLPIISERRPYRPDWNYLLLMLYAILLYACYAVIAFVPATAEEIEEHKAAGNTVLGNLGTTAVSVVSVVFATIGATLVALPGMIGEALNPTLAIKTIGNRVYKVVGTGYMHSIWGILGLAFLAILVFAIIMFAALVLALGGTFALGIIAVVKFFLNNFFYRK